MHLPSSIQEAAYRDEGGSTSWKQYHVGVYSDGDPSVVHGKRNQHIQWPGPLF